MRITLWLGALLLVLAASALAQEERIIDNFAGVGTRAMGMGGSFVGVADDFTALYWNPAGLAQMQHHEVQAAFTRNGLTMESARSGISASSDLASTRVDALGGVYRVPVQRGSLVVAAGYNRVQAFDWVLREPGLTVVEPPPGSPAGTPRDSVLADNSYRHEGGIALTAFGAAVDVSPTVSLGATLGFTNGEDRSQTSFDWRDTLGTQTWRRAQDREAYDDNYGVALHAALGGLMRYPREEPRVRVGAQVTYSGVHDVSYVFRGIPDPNEHSRVEYDDGLVVSRQDTTESGSYRIALPLEMSAGVSVVPVAGLLLAGSVHVAEWKQTEYKGTDAEELAGATSFQSQYRNVARYHVGAEWQVPAVALDLRAGYYTDPLPFVGPLDPAADVDPETNPLVVVDQDRRFTTLGAGLVVDQVVHLDLAWVHGHYKQHEGRLSEKWTGDRVFASVACRF